MNILNFFFIAGQEDSMMSEDQPALEKTDTLESDSLALEEDSNMADTDENSTTANNDESNGGIAAPDITREESFVSCINEEGDQTITNVSNEDPFESFAGKISDFQATKFIGFFKIKNGQSS